MTIPTQATTFTSAAAGVVAITALLGFRSLAAPQDPPPAPVEPAPTAPAQQPDTPPGTQKDLVQVATEQPRLKTFVQAINAAGLTETLKGKGPFTILAPSDSAFSRVPKEQLDELSKPENKEKLAALLRMHVVPGTLTKADLRKMEEGSEVRTLGGVLVVKQMPQLTLNGANSAKLNDTDIAAGNGVLHTIDTVLLPAAPPGAAEGQPVTPPPPAPAEGGETPPAPPPVPAPAPPPAP